MAITATVLADSTYIPFGYTSFKPRVTTLALKYHRFFHSEFMTHRVFSRNASSSRAIPVKTMLAQVWNDPAMPLYWGKNQSGMQAKEELTGWRRWAAEKLWRTAGKAACVVAWSMTKVGLHKQTANRILEPWQWIHVIVTATEWDNFFALRDHPDAQPEIQELAKQIKIAMDASTPRVLAPWEWHLPLVTDEEIGTIGDYSILKMISAARCARVSYLTHEGKTPVIENDIKLYYRLVGSAPIHASPVEHQCKPAMDELFHRNFKGFIQFREEVETMNQEER